MIFSCLDHRNHCLLKQMCWKPEAGQRTRRKQEQTKLSTSAVNQQQKAFFKPSGLVDSVLISKMPTMTLNRGPEFSDWDYNDLLIRGVGGSGCCTLLFHTSLSIQLCCFVQTDSLLKDLVKIKLNSLYIFGILVLHLALTVVCPKEPHYHELI